MKIPLNKALVQWFMLFTGMIFVTSCNTMRDGLLHKKSPHERYVQLLEQSGLDETKLGSRWLAEAVKALDSPVTIEAPYRETGYFPAEHPTAAGFLFSLRTGEVIVATIEMRPPQAANIFFDLWEKREGENRLLAASDSSNLELRHEIEEEGQYILRVQPELLSGIEYTLTITTAPSLAFPVHREDNPRVQSYWGAARDGGSRSHEGIDIFAARGTPALAAADGRVTRVNENTLGGRVVFMRPEGKNYSLYYAHLDTQLVRAGQQVRAGEVIGLIGNTGNAKTTPPHLHLGIYSTSGAVDPFPFVNDKRDAPPTVNASTKLINSFGRNAASLTLGGSSAGTELPLASNSLLRIIAASGNSFRVQLPDGKTGFVKEEYIRTNAFSMITLKKTAPLFDSPDSNSARVTILQPGTQIRIIGRHGNFQWINTNELEGWLSLTDQPFN